jgi:hypothetical protein
MCYRMAGVDVHRKMLAVVVSPSVKADLYRMLVDALSAVSGLEKAPASFGVIVVTPRLQDGSYFSASSLGSINPLAIKY